MRACYCVLHGSDRLHAQEICELTMAAEIQRNQKRCMTGVTEWMLSCAGAHENEVLQEASYSLARPANGHDNCLRERPHITVCVCLVRMRLTGNDRYTKQAAPT